MSSKRRKLSNSDVEVTYKTYQVLCLNSDAKPVTKTCNDHCQVYDISSALHRSPPPYHRSHLLLDKWDPPNVTLHVGSYSFYCHKHHLRHCCQYFQGMFGNSMAESSKTDITIHGIDDESFRSIITGFYTGLLSLCSDCIIAVWQTATFLEASSVLTICETYILSHLSVDNVFEFLDESITLGFDTITQAALQLICINLAPDPNLFETEEFLALTPAKMALVLSGHKTNCTETVLARAIFKWADQALGNLTSYVSFKEANMSSKRSLNVSSESGILVGDEYIVELFDDSLPQHSLIELQGNVIEETLASEGISPGTFEDNEPTTSGVSSHGSIDVTTVTVSDQDVPSSPPKPKRTYKRKRTRHTKSNEEIGKRKRKLEISIDDVDEGVVSDKADATITTQKKYEDSILNVLQLLEYHNMEKDVLKSFLSLDVINYFPSLSKHVKSLSTGTQFKWVPERGSKSAITLCYHKSYRSSEHPARTIVLYYYCNNRWHVLNNSFDINLASVKTVVLNDILYVFGMQKISGQLPISRAFRFNQFTGLWREISSPCDHINANTRCLIHNGRVLLIGTAKYMLSSEQQQSYLNMAEYDPVANSWTMVDAKFPITYYELQRQVNSIISHQGKLYYISKNKLFSFCFGEEGDEAKELAVVSLMFSEISNYWLFGHQHTLFLLGGMCYTEGGGSWENREIMMYDLDNKTWSILQNSKPSPMYEMMSAMVHQDKIYTVSHGTTGGENIAKLEMFDINKSKWKKGINVKYESPVYSIEYGLQIGCMLIKCFSDED